MTNDLANDGIEPATDAGNGRTLSVMQAPVGSSAIRRDLRIDDLDDSDTFFTLYRGPRDNVGAAMLASWPEFCRLVTQHVAINMEAFAARRRMLRARCASESEFNVKLARIAKGGPAVAVSYMHGTRRATAPLWRDMVAFDIDSTAARLAPPFREFCQRVAALGYDFAAATTFSHTVAAPRYRAFIRLAQAQALGGRHDADKAAAYALARKLEIASIIDLGKLGAESLFVLPRCRIDGAPPDSFVNPLPTRLAEYDMTCDPDTVPVSARGSRPHRLAPQYEGTEARRHMAAVAEALTAIPNDGHEGRQVRGTWITVGLGLKHAFGDSDGFLLWQHWSLGYPGNTPDILAETWRGLRPDGRAGLGSIFWLAESHGWRGHTTLPVLTGLPLLPTLSGWPTRPRILGTRP